MYAWIWRHLPGTTLRVRALIAAGLVALVAVLLWFAVFPWTETHLRFDNGTVGGSSPQPARHSHAP